MLIRPRVIPVLLLKNGGLVKTVKFKKPTYVGDPINAVKIFNEKEVDELVFLDIEASKNNSKPNFEKLREIAGECFMPLCYGGGIKTIEDIRNVIQSGVEKVAISTAAIENPEFIKQASDIFGSSTIVISIDVKKNLFGKYQVTGKSGKIKSKLSLVEFINQMQNFGAGEILINNIDKDGTFEGYDTVLIKQISELSELPVISCGGAKDVKDFENAIESGASAVAAGSIFVFTGVHKAVLINFPEQKDLDNLALLKR